jgi:hypothetical protein
MVLMGGMERSLTMSALIVATTTQTNTAQEPTICPSNEDNKRGGGSSSRDGGQNPLPVTSPSQVSRVFSIRGVSSRRRLLHSKVIHASIVIIDHRHSSVDILVATIAETVHD